MISEPPVSVEEVVFLEVVVEAEYGSRAMLDRDRIEAALRRALASFAGEPLYSTPFSRAAVVMSALLELARDRLAVMVAALWLEKEGYRLEVAPDDLYATAASAALGATDVDRLAEWLKGNVVTLS